MVVNWLAASGLGAGDCEAIRSGFLAQPGNALSSVAFVVAGIALIVLGRGLPHAGRVAVAGALLIAVSAGSFLYHGPAPAAAQFVHDVTIAGLIGFLAWWSAGSVLSRRVWLAAAAGIVTALAVLPTISGVVLAFVAAIGGGAVVVRLGRVRALRGRLAILVLLTSVAWITFALGSSGGMWCSPDSLLQAHAVWHALSATALSLAVVFLAQAPLLGGSDPAHERFTR